MTKKIQKNNYYMSSGEKLWLAFGNFCAVMLCIISIISLPFLTMLSGFAYDSPNQNFIVATLFILTLFLLVTIAPWVYLWSSWRSWKWYNGNSDKLAQYAFLHPFIPIIIGIAGIVIWS